MAVGLMSSLHRNSWNVCHNVENSGITYVADGLACQPLKPKKLAAARKKLGTLNSLLSIRSRTMQSADPKT